MHPPLHRPHPSCGDFVKALEKCHRENSMMKFLGACNDAKRALDHCFRLEKQAKRDANFRKAQHRREILTKMRPGVAGQQQSG